MNTVMFLPLLSVYALLFNMAGVPSWKLNMCQIIVSTARGIRSKFCETVLMFKSLKCERISETKSIFSATFDPPLVSIVVVVLLQS